MGFNPDDAGGREKFLNYMLLRLQPLMERNIDSFHLLSPGAASLLQVASIVGQYNRMVERSNDDPSRLNGQLLALRQAITDAMREIGPLHDEAVQNAPID
jgi:hypothetical protein